MKKESQACKKVWADPFQTLTLRFAEWGQGYRLLASHQPTRHFVDGFSGRKYFVKAIKHLVFQIVGRTRGGEFLADGGRWLRRWRDECN